MLGVLSACGGGGGSGSGGGSVSGAFTISANSVTFSARQNAAVPSSQSLTIQITGPNVAYAGAAYTGGQTPPSWLSFSSNGSGGTYQLVLSVTSTGLAPGQYTTTFQVGTTDSAGKVLQYQSVTVTYNVLVAVEISSQAYSGTFTYGGSKTTDNASVAVSASGLQWKSTSDSPWLTVPTGTQTGTGSVQAAIDVAGLTPGTYQGHVTITDQADSTNSATVAFSVTVQAPTIVATQTSVVLGGADGLSTTTPQSITFSLSTDTVMHPFAITLQTLSGGNWLSSDTTAGSVDAAGTTIQVSGDRTGLVGGTYLARVQIAATVGSIVVTGEVPVTFNVEANRIVVGASGVGFSSSPAGSVLTRAVTVFDSLGRTDVPWQATSDEPWLTVTPSGVTGGALTLTAAPSGLPTDSTQFATVTVRSSDTSVENTETIRVGLYVASAAPVDLSLSVPTLTLAASPVEPIVFVANGGTDVTGYNVYTGVADRTFAGVATEAGPMVMSGDGQYLFVYDWSNQQVSQLDAATGALVHQYSSTTLSPYGGGMAYVRPDGHAMIITPSSRAYDVATGIEYDNAELPGVTSAVSLETSPDNSKLITDQGNVYNIVRSALNGGELNVALIFNTGTTPGTAGQACISADGLMAYTASGMNGTASPYDFLGTSLATHQVTQTLHGQEIPDAIACVWNGLIVGGTDVSYGSTDVFVYGPTGTQLAVLESSAQGQGYHDLLARDLAVSADGTRMITIVGLGSSRQGSEVRFQTLPPP